MMTGRCFDSGPGTMFTPGHGNGYTNSRWSAEMFWLIYWSASKPTGQFVYPKYKELK